MPRPRLRALAYIGNFLLTLALPVTATPMLSTLVMSAAIGRRRETSVPPENGLWVGMSADATATDRVAGSRPAFYRYNRCKG